jgi:hypothetical protein
MYCCVVGFGVSSGMLSVGGAPVDGVSFGLLGAVESLGVLGSLGVSGVFGSLGALGSVEESPPESSGISGVKPSSKMELLELSLRF